MEKKENSTSTSELSIDIYTDESSDDQTDDRFYHNDKRYSGLLEDDE